MLLVVASRQDAVARGLVSRWSVRLAPTDLTRLEAVRWCPTQFQQYIPGPDYRVHVVGDELFACMITSDADDYRYAHHQAQNVAVQACYLTPEVAEICRTLAAGLGLRVAGIDLRRASDGAWYCFEVNPSPAFSYFQQAAGLPIGGAIARLLAHGARPLDKG